MAAFYQPLYRFAYSLARNETEAADLTQQAFLVLAQHRNAIREQDKVKSWLFTTLRREFLKGARHRASHPEVEFESGRHDPPTAGATGATSADAHTILEALDRVDETFQTALKMFYLSELSYREIAEILEVPIGTVMSRLSRGKEQLRACLADLRGRGDSKVVPLPPQTGRSDG